MVGVRGAQPEPYCPYFRHAVELIGRRWTGAILRALQADVRHFSALVGTIPGLSDRMLSERLRELEAEGLVQRQVIPEMPVRVEYGLTTKGRALGEVFAAISAWAAAWHDDAPFAAEATGPLDTTRLTGHAALPLAPARRHEKVETSGGCG